MFSVRGVISTPLAMMECASSQINNIGIPRGFISGRRSSVFLLSELEKVWSALSVLLRQSLNEGKAVKISNFGSFWLEEFVILTTSSPPTATAELNRFPEGRSGGRTQYSTRQLFFGFHPRYAIKYNLSSEKIWREKPLTTYTKIAPSSLVALSEVPAYRVMHILQEFFLYLGESIFLGKVFQIDFPGVATLFIRKEQMLLRPCVELQQDLLEVDAKRWPSEIKVRCKAALLSEYCRDTCSDRCPSSEGAVSVGCAGGAGRVSSSRSCSSRHGLPRRSLPPQTPVQHPSVFVSTAARGKCFSDLEREIQWRAEKEERSRRMLSERKRKVGVDEATLQAEIERIEREIEKEQSQPNALFRKSGVPPQSAVGAENEAYDDDNYRLSQGMTNPPMTSGESVYAWEEGDDGGGTPTPSSRAYLNGAVEEKARPQMSKITEQGHEEAVEEGVIENNDDDGDDVEVVEVTVDRPLPATSSAAYGSMQWESNFPSHNFASRGIDPPSYRVDPNSLSSTLRKEEPFSRPLSRRYHEHSSVRDLIYNNPCAARDSTASSSRHGGISEMECTSSGRPIHRHPPRPVGEMNMMGKGNPHSYPVGVATPPSTGTPSLGIAAPSAVSSSSIHFGRKRFGIPVHPGATQKEYAMISSLHNGVQQVVQP